MLLEDQRQRAGKNPKITARFRARLGQGLSFETGQNRHSKKGKVMVRVEGDHTHAIHGKIYRKDIGHSQTQGTKPHKPLQVFKSDICAMK